MPRVDLSAYEGREQAYVKHCLLEEYLPAWAYKIGSGWDTLVYVDGFAGPWKVTTPTFDDSSFGVAIDKLKKVFVAHRDQHGRSIDVFCVLVGDTKEKAAKLRAFGNSRSIPRFRVEAVCGKFAEQIPKICELIQQNARNHFRFIFLDPKGWSDIPMRDICPLLRGRSCEVLVNLMTSDIRRFLDLPQRAQSYERLFGRKEVLGILQQTPPEERGERAVQEYCKSLKQICNFNYVSSAVIFEPEREEVKYFLVFATNHHDGIGVFKAAEIAAARIQDAVREELIVRRTGQRSLFDVCDMPRSKVRLDRRRRYVDRAYQSVVKTLLEKRRKDGVLYRDLLMEAWAFPLVTAEDLKDWLKRLSPAVQISFDTSSTKRRLTPVTDKDDRVVVKDELLLADWSVAPPPPEVEGRER